jgi:hypothetical protein
MPLDPSWWAVGGPFADNTTGDITAQDLRSFAQEVGTEGRSADWFNYEPDLYYDAIEYKTVDLAQTIWFNLPASPTFYEQSINWSSSTDAGSRTVWNYISDEEMFLYVSLVPGSLTLTNIGEDVSITPIVVISEDDAESPVYVGATKNVWPIDKTQTTSSAGTVSVDLNLTKFLRFPSAHRSVRVGVLLTPPSGEPISPIAEGTFVAAADMRVLVMTRLASVID